MGLSPMNRQCMRRREHIAAHLTGPLSFKNKLMFQLEQKTQLLQDNWLRY